jgi:hypothetical protein
MQCTYFLEQTARINLFLMVCRLFEGRYYVEELLGYFCL